MFFTLLYGHFLNRNEVAVCIVDSAYSHRLVAYYIVSAKSMLQYQILISCVVVCDHFYGLKEILKLALSKIMLRVFFKKRQKNKSTAGCYDLIPLRLRFLYKFPYIFYKQIIQRKNMLANNFIALHYWQQITIINTIKRIKFNSVPLKVSC